MIPLDDSYEELIDPVQWVKSFATDEQFENWCRTMNGLSDLRDLRTVFEKHELYEHCGMIQKVIDEKVDEYLDGLGFGD